MFGEKSQDYKYNKEAKEMDIGMESVKTNKIQQRGEKKTRTLPPNWGKASPFASPSWARRATIKKTNKDSHSLNRLSTTPTLA